MKLKSFGCSFIFGTDLSNYNTNGKIPTPSKHTWPAYLARHLEYQYRCYARPGSGNLQIAERVLSHATQFDGDLFVIGWTWIDRFDYRNSFISNTPIATKWNNWKTLMPIDNSNLAKTYYQGLHSEFQDKLCSLMYIKLVIDTLTQKKIPFLMTYMDELLFDQQWNTTEAIIDLQNYVRPHMTQFDNMNFLEWSRAKGFDISATWHPLEQAHRVAADYMIKIFDTQKTNDPVQLAHV
jgi:hypothetical protein